MTGPCHPVRGALASSHLQVEDRTALGWPDAHIEACAREAFLGAAPQQESAVGQLPVAHHRRTSELLHGDAPVTLHAILDEAALRRAVGGREGMCEQLQYLVELSHLDHVRIQAVPAGAGTLPIRADFRIITYPEPSDLELIYQESASDGIWLNHQPDDTLDQ